MLYPYSLSPSLSFLSVSVCLCLSLSLALSLSPTDRRPWDNLPFKWNLLWVVSAHSLSHPQTADPKTVHTWLTNKSWFGISCGGKWRKQQQVDRTGWGSRGHSRGWWWGGCSPPGKQRRSPACLCPTKVRFCNKRPAEEFPVKPKTSPAAGRHESGWVHSPWERWLYVAVWPLALGSHPQVVSVLHPHSAPTCKQSAVHNVRSQLAPTSTVCPRPHSAHTHKYSLSYIMYAVNLHPQVQCVLHNLHSV